MWLGLARSEHSVAETLWVNVSAGVAIPDGWSLGILTKKFLATYPWYTYKPVSTNRSFSLQTAYKQKTANGHSRWAKLEKKIICIPHVWKLHDKMIRGECASSAMK